MRSKPIAYGNSARLPQPAIEVAIAGI